MKKTSEPLAADYPVIELAGAHRLILGLPDGRMFGVDLDEAFEGELPGFVSIVTSGLDEAGVPQDARYLNP